jgi:endonuclease/exonuclease/phosphatase family metal-dependent hydrolase
MEKVRVATLNVHGWSSHNLTSNVPLLTVLLRMYDLDILSLNEACHTSNKPKDPLLTFAKSLKMPHVSFGKCAYFQGFGNAIISKHAITYEKNHKAGTRSMLQVQNDHPFAISNNLTLYSLHLDPLNEEKRLQQLNLFSSQMSNKGFEIVMGDFNAICTDGTDYTESYFKTQISDVRAKNNKESPKGDVYKWMLEHGFEDIFRTVNKQDKDAAISTCRFSTRIDYIWSRGVLSDGWTLSSCSIVSCGKATDHNMVLCEFTKTN